MPHDSTLNSSPVPYGYCHCGCGRKTNISPATCVSRGYVRGKPYRYILGHARKQMPYLPILLPMQNTAAIPLSDDVFALLDIADLHNVFGHIWRKRAPANVSYAECSRFNRDGRTHKGYLMHQAIIPDQDAIDHRNGNGLDNRRCNLRPCDASQNQANRITFNRAGTSRFRGVTWHKGVRKWQVAIKCRGTNYYLGLFESEEKAALAYNAAAAELFGEFARLNEVTS